MLIVGTEVTMKIKEIRSIEDVVSFLNSEKFENWIYRSVCSVQTPIHVWSAETVQAKVFCTSQRKGSWGFEVCAESLTSHKERFWSFESTITDDPKFTKHFSKWITTAITYYRRDIRELKKDLPQGCITTENSVY